MECAIKALEQPELYEDAVSRQAAIDAMCNACSDWCDEGVCKKVSALQKLPSAQPEQRWIPVSERSPEDNGWYQCTVILDNLSLTMDLFYKNGKWLDNRRISMYNIYDIYGYGNTTEKHKLSYQELISEFDWTKNVIAWMLLPKPYVPDINVGEMTNKVLMVNNTPIDDQHE